MQRIIDPVPRDLLISELTPERFVRPTKYGNREIYIITAQDSPHVMQELGRLREISFRDAGGGTGMSVDIDEYDTCENPYKQLLVWSPQDKEIVGGYRFQEGYNILGKDGKIHSATGHLFHFSEKFKKEYLPFTIELGRSFVQPHYQPSSDLKRGIYSLDNLWDGLGALIVDYPDMKYYFGKFTMYPRYHITARDMILFFLKKYFGDKEKLVYPKHPVKIVTETSYLKNIFIGSTYEEDYKILQKNLRRFDEAIPPLVNAYMNLSPTMKTFGTAINHEFGEVEETGILITIADIYDVKVERHVADYQKP